MSQKKSRIILKNIEKYSSLNFLQKLNETAFKIIKAKLLKLINNNFHSILKHWFTCRKIVVKKSKLENFSEEKDMDNFLTAKSELLYCN